MEEVEDIQEEEVVESVGDEDRLVVGERERIGKSGEVALAAEAVAAAVKEDNDDKEAVVIDDETWGKPNSACASSRGDSRRREARSSRQERVRG